MALTNVVVRALPFHFTVEPEAKPAPFTDRVKSEAPATTLDGESEQIAGDEVENTDEADRRRDNHIAAAART